MSSSASGEPSAALSESPEDASNSAGGASGVSSGQSSPSSSAGGSSEDKEQSDNSHITVNITIDGGGYADVNYSGDVKIDAGATVYDALCATGISVNARDTQYGVYVVAIGGLASGSAGGESGWKYSVNATEPACSCSVYALSGGETIKWKFVTRANEAIG